MAKQRFEAELALNINGFLQGLEKANKGFIGLSSTLAAAGGAMKLVNDAFRNMEQGQKLLSLAGAAYKQVLADLTQGHLLNANSIYQAIQRQKEWNDIQEKNLFEGVKVAQLTTQIEELRYKMADAATTEAEKTKLASEALKIYNERKQFQIANLKEEANWYITALEKNPDDKELRKGFIVTATQLQTLMGFDREARTLNALATQVTPKLYGLAEAFERDAEAARQADEEFQKYRQSLQYLESGYKLETLQGRERVTPARGLGFNVNPELAPVKFADIQANQIIQQNILWAEQEQIILSLADSFSNMFATAGEGFQSMADMMIAGFKRMVMEVAAKAGILMLLSVVTGQPLMTMANLFPNLSALTGGTGSPVSSGYGNMGLQGILANQALTVQGQIRGKDIRISNRRNG
jgi:hypothetical protein